MTEENYFSDCFKSSIFPTIVEIERFELRLDISDSNVPRGWGVGVGLGVGVGRF